MDLTREKGWAVTQVEEHLLRKGEALSSNPSTTKKLKSGKGDIVKESQTICLTHCPLHVEYL
jgi:uncharacterized protein YlzI (FlbEa/FlbD family)